MQKALLTLVFLLIALVFVYFDHSGFGPPATAPKTESAVRVSDFEKYNGKTFTVVYVVDGDTLDLGVSDNNKARTRIRLWGVDTPETKDPRYAIGYFGPEASEWTKKTTLGKNVQIFLDAKDTRDRYKRLLVYIKLDDGRFLNEALLSEGYAYADRRFKHNYYNKYLQLESSARRGKKGLWENVTREQLPEWLQREEPTLLKKK